MTCRIFYYGSKWSLVRNDKKKNGNVRTSSIDRFASYHNFLVNPLASLRRKLFSPNGLQKYHLLMDFCRYESFTV